MTSRTERFLGGIVWAFAVFLAGAAHAGSVALAGFNMTTNGAGTMTVTGSDSGGDAINISGPVDLSPLGGMAFVGFTGASASGSADEEITSFSFTVGAPEPATVTVVVAVIAGLIWLRKRR